VVEERNWAAEKSVVEVRGWVDLVLRERGKIVPGSSRNGHNVWTNVGREYLTQLMTLNVANVPGAVRSDSVAYMGAGSGVQLEEPGVVRLAGPVESILGQFLTGIDQAEYVGSPRTTVRYKKIFREDELTFTVDSRMAISELGLFTNGAPDSIPPNQVGRNPTFNIASTQAPVAYKCFDQVTKTGAMQLEVSWEIRF
jgi:hypothetical protein